MNSNETVPPITEEDIAEYLLNTPEFFVRHAQVLATVQIVSPHSHRAVSLQERQAEMLREKIKALEHRIMDLMRNGSQNHHTVDKIHGWACEVARTRNPVQLPQSIVQGLREHFDVPQAAVKLWDVSESYLREGFAQGASDDTRSFASSLTAPYCGPNMGVEAVRWLPDAQQVQSVALLPLRDGPLESDAPAWGLLVLGSPDAERFDAEMSTDFLARIGELSSGLLSRLR
ncbi:MAG: DUF484 family protein [Comamonas sp.]